MNKFRINEPVQCAQSTLVDPDYLSNMQSKAIAYDELIMAVAKKYPNETRHETALRIITENQNRCDGVAKQEMKNE